MDKHHLGIMLNFIGREETSFLLTHVAARKACSGNCRRC